MSSFKTRLTQARLRARNLIKQGHVSTDVVAVIDDLIEMTVEFERLLTQAEGSSGDIRVLKSRVELLNQDLRKKDSALHEFKKSVVDVLSVEMKNITNEVQKLVAAAPASESAQDGTVQDCAKAITQSLRKIVELISKQ